MIWGIIYMIATCIWETTVCEISTVPAFVKTYDSQMMSAKSDDTNTINISVHKQLHAFRSCPRKKPDRRPVANLIRKLTKIKLNRRSGFAKLGLTSLINLCIVDEPEWLITLFFWLHAGYGWANFTVLLPMFPRLQKRSLRTGLFVQYSCPV